MELWMNATSANQHGTLGFTLSKSDAEDTPIQPGDKVIFEVKRIVRDGEEVDVE